MLGPLLFHPLYKTRDWGGRTIGHAFGRELSEPGRIGESWEIVDRLEEQSVVASGPHAGRTLRQLIEANGAALMGTSWDVGRCFPILVKWLDCHDRLSLQVHPPAAVAAELDGEPKTEHWYIARAEPPASLFVGLRRGVTRDQFERHLTSGKLEALVHRCPVQAGDSMLVPSGRIHAIDGGNLILEIQQNSDTTYRVYDWGRPRELHVEAALRSIDFSDFEPQVVPSSNGDALLADCAEFRIHRVVREPGEVFDLPDGAPQPRLLSVIAGEVAVMCPNQRERYRTGDNVLLPADTWCDIHAESAATLLYTDNFTARFLSP
jgi:mannose-6-phosphate isomerase